VNPGGIPRHTVAIIVFRSTDGRQSRRAVKRLRDVPMGGVVEFPSKNAIAKAVNASSGTTARALPILAASPSISGTSNAKEAPT
jgi:hypothetical protein